METNTWHSVVIAGIAGVAPTIAALTAAIIAWHHMRVHKRDQIVENEAHIGITTRVDKLHESTNSKMDLLLKVLSEAEFAKGQLQGRKDQQEEDNKWRKPFPSSE